MKEKIIVISRSYSRVDQFRAAYKSNGKRLYNILGCEIDGFSLFHNEYPAATITNEFIKEPGTDGLKVQNNIVKRDARHDNG